MAYYSESDEDFIYDDDGYVNVWTDGCCLYNGKPWAQAGYGVFYNSNHYMNTAAPVEGRATNNTAEIEAAIRAIWDCSYEDVEGLVINTDSKFLCSAVWEWLPMWKRNNFYKSNGEPLANRREFIHLWTAMIHNPDMDIEFVHVRAHCGDPYNDEADRLAWIGAQQY